MNFVLDNILYERWQCGKRFRGFVSNDLVKLRELVTCDEGETEVEVLNEPFNPFLSGDRRWRFAYRSQMNKLIACVVKPYEITLESGRKILVDNERWVGYITEDDDDGYFRGAEFALEEDGWEDCGYLKLSREYFESHVQSWKEVEF